MDRRPELPPLAKEIRGGLVASIGFGTCAALLLFIPGMLVSAVVGVALTVILFAVWPPSRYRW